MKNKKYFKVIIEESSDDYFVTSFPSLPGCHTQDKSLKELEKRIKEAIELCLDVKEKI